MAQPAAPSFELWRISRARYDRLVEANAFDSDDRVELLDGLLIAREPQGSRHAAIVGHIGVVLERAFGRRFHVREDKPFALDDMSEPEPDLVVLRGRHLDYLRAHPSVPALVVEVAETSLPKDRRLKVGLYARAGITDYWIVNLVEGVVEVYRRPERAPARRQGWTYGHVQRLERADVVSPLAVPRVRLRVAQLLPPPDA